MRVSRTFEDSPKILIVSRCSWTLFKFRLPLIRYLQSQGFTVSTAGYDLHDAEHDLICEGVQHHSLGPLNSKNPLGLNKLRYIIRLFFLMKKNKFSVVHFFTMQPVLLGSISSLLSRTPSVITITGLGHLFLRKKNAKFFLLKQLMKNATRNANTCIFQNEDDLDTLKRGGYLSAAANIHIIRGSGVNIDRYRPRLNKIVGNPIEFLMVARFIREKGITEYCEAVSKLSEDVTANAIFSLIGEIDEHNPTSYTQEEILHLTSKSGVKLLAHQKDVLKILQSSDVIVLPSHREGMSMALLEGCAVGLAAVANNVPGCKEIIKHGETGLLVEAHDVNALSSALQTLVHNPHKINTFGSAGRVHVSMHFADSIVFEKVFEIYIKVLDKRNRTSSTTKL